ncbi:hypothetical protein EBU95_19965, partial [bacterium]|nr:hypothetical protein [bacterium]
MSSTTIAFSAFNYTGGGSSTVYTKNYYLTGYTLPNSIFTFITPAVATIGNLPIWDFGDGTTATGFSAVHYYKLPGIYRVTNYWSNTLGTVYSNTYSVILSVYDFVKDSLSIAYDPND